MSLLFDADESEFTVLQEGGMETDDLHSEVSKLQLSMAEEDSKMQRYKVRNEGHIETLFSMWK